MSVTSAGVVIYAGSSSPAAVPADFIDAIDTIVIRQRHDRASTFQLVINADRAKGSATELPVISEATVTPGTRVKIAIRLDSTQQGVIDGVVTFQELTYSGGATGLTYSVIGEDLSVYMRLTEKATEWPGRSYSQIAREIIGNYSRYGLTTTIVAPQQDVTPPQNGWIPQQNTTDLDYLRALGRAFGYIFAIRASASIDGQSTAYWGPPSRDGTSLPLVTVEGGASGNVQSVEFMYDAAGAEVYGGGSRNDDDTQTALAISATYGLGGLTALSKDSGTSPALLRTRVFVEPSFAGSLATASAASLGVTSARGTLRARAVVDGLLYGTVVTPSSLITVGGAGDAHNGLYYVESVEHQLQRNKYTQTIEMTREGFGTTITQAAS